MSLKDTLNEGIKNAMKAKDKATLRTLRSLKSVIMLAETAEGRDPNAPLTEAEEMKILTKQAKQRRDSMEQYLQNGRDELAQIEKEELEIIEQFLPKQLSEAEIKSEVEKIIADTGASGMKDMGKVMGIASKKMAGRADGKVISGVVRGILAG